MADLKGENDADGRPWAASTIDFTGEDPEDDIDFKEEDSTVGAVVMMDLNGKVDEYMLTVALGEAGGVMVIEDLSNSNPAVVAEGSREENNEDVTPFTGEGEDLNDLIGDAKSLMDLTEEVVEASKVDLRGEEEETDQTDFNGEAVGVLDVELDRDVIPDFTCPATVMGAAAQD
ncbi:hypothetical protein scyTo_0011350 [Scyliorhinus torazame]|uniref:Uncharacterized protein n=1 Tax=Scyliorhinus torazame TaxID=75743 RepID=A0A401NL97_SCYTO|nr:hypothetical protein [Scyliorhinus torazame]